MGIKYENGILKFIKGKLDVSSWAGKSEMWQKHML